MAQGGHAVFRLENTMTAGIRLPLFCLAATILILIWSGIGPHDRATWFLEVAPVLIAIPLFIFTWKKFPLTDLLYILAFIHGTILMVGGHYTYAHVPHMEWLGDGRNNYDKIGHFAQGFIPAIAARELLLRTSPLRPGKWLSTIIILSCLGISALYELIEWAVAEMFGQGAQEFLGTQGDEWDTQKDMMWAGIGAASALTLLSRLHDRALNLLAARYNSAGLQTP